MQLPISRGSLIPWKRTCLLLPFKKGNNKGRYQETGLQLLKQAVIYDLAARLSLRSPLNFGQCAKQAFILQALHSQIASPQRRDIWTLFHLLANGSVRLQECLTRTVKCGVSWKRIEDLETWHRWLQGIHL